VKAKITLAFLNILILCLLVHGIRDILQFFNFNFWWA